MTDSLPCDFPLTWKQTRSLQTVINSPYLRKNIEHWLTLLLARNVAISERFNRKTSLTSNIMIIHDYRSLFISHLHAKCRNCSDFVGILQARGPVVDILQQMMRPRLPTHYGCSRNYSEPVHRVHMCSQWWVKVGALGVGGPVAVGGAVVVGRMSTGGKCKSIGLDVRG